MKIDIIDISGTKVEEFKLSKDVFAVTPHEQSVYDAVVLANANIRQATAKTKNRSAVRGGGRKPWRQKGTGRARHGSIRSPIWVGGGVTFGPTGEQNYKLKQNKKEAKLALKSALSIKIKDKAVMVLDKFVVESGKTKDMVKVLETLKTKGKTLIVATEGTTSLETFRAVSNLAKVAMMLIEKEESEQGVLYNVGINVYDLLNAETLIMTKEAIQYVEEVLS